MSKQLATASPEQKIGAGENVVSTPIPHRNAKPDGDTSEEECSNPSRTKTERLETTRLKRKPSEEWIMPDEKYDGSTPWKYFEAKFKYFSKYNGWDENDKRIRLMASLEGLAEELLYEERKDVAELSFEQLCHILGELFGPENVTGGLKELPMTETIKGATALETLRGLLSGQVAQLNALMFGDEAADKLISRIVTLRISYIPRMTTL